MIVVVLFLILSVILEASFISLPLTFSALLFWTVTTQRKEVFALAFFSGLFLDVLTFRSLGISSAYFILVILAAFLYRSKFEINTAGFIGVFGFLGSLGYMLINGLQSPLLGSFLT